MEDNKSPLAAWFRILGSSHVSANEKAIAKPIIDKVNSLWKFLDKR